MDRSDEIADLSNDMASNAPNSPNDTNNITHSPAASGAMITGNTNPAVSTGSSRSQNGVRDRMMIDNANPTASTRSSRSRNGARVLGQPMTGLRSLVTGTEPVVVRDEVEGRLGQIDTQLTGIVRSRSHRRRGRSIPSSPIIPEAPPNSAQDPAARNRSLTSPVLQDSDSVDAQVRAIADQPETRNARNANQRLLQRLYEVDRTRAPTPQMRLELVNGMSLSVLD